MMQGTCLCGAVNIEAELDLKDIHVCHCGMCRKWGGGPSLNTEAKKAVKITGEGYISVFESSEWASRHFCKICGTNLYYQLKNVPHHFSLNVNLFDFEDQESQIKTEIYSDHKPAYYQFLSDAQKLTEQEVLALFGDST